jgi:hypothetical protein
LEDEYWHDCANNSDVVEKLGNVNLPPIIDWLYFQHKTRLNLPLFSLVIVMPTPRSQQISLLDTQFYHICSRTVRNAFLCGVDKETGISFEHKTDP